MLSLTFQLYQHSILLELSDNLQELFYQQMDYTFLLDMVFQRQHLEHSIVLQDMSKLDGMVLQQHRQFLKLYCK